MFCSVGITFDGRLKYLPNVRIITEIWILLPNILLFMILIRLDEESEGITIRFGFFDETGTQMVGSDPFAKIANVLGMVRNGLAPDLVQFFGAQDEFCSVHGR